MTQKYNLTEIQDYFQNWDSPEETAAKINSAIVTMTDLYLKSDDLCVSSYEVKKSMDFLINLRMAIEHVKPIED